MILHLNPDLYMQLVGIERFRKFAKEAKTTDLPVKAGDGLQLRYSSKIFKAVSFNPSVVGGHNFAHSLWSFMERVEQTRNTILSVSRPG